MPRKSNQVARLRWLRCPWTLLLAAAALAALATWYVGWRASPEQIRDRAVAALERVDASYLCGLADREELRRLSLTAQAVAGLLTDAGWRVGRKRPRFESAQQPSDLATWKVAFSTSDPDERPVVVSLIYIPKAGWKLNLSVLLWSVTHQARPRGGGGALYRELARKYGILGVRTYDGDYLTNEDMEARIRRRGER